MYVLLLLVFLYCDFPPRLLLSRFVVLSPPPPRSHHCLTQHIMRMSHTPLALYDTTGADAPFPSSPTHHHHL